MKDEEKSRDQILAEISKLRQRLSALETLIPSQDLSFDEKEVDMPVLAGNQIAELRESEARFRALSNASFEAIFLSEKGICIDQNRTAEKIFGYTRADAVGRPGTDWIVPEDREQVRTNMLSGYKKPYKVNALRKNGTTVPVEIQGRMFNYQNRLIRVTALRDISELKKAENTLRMSEERFRELSEMLPGAVFEMDFNGTILFANRHALEYFGYTQADFEQGLNSFDMIIPADRDRALEEVGKALNGEKIGPTEYIGLKKDGSTFPVLIYLTRSFDKDNPVSLRGFVIDITKRKQAEEELWRSRERFKAILEANPDPVVVYNKLGYPLYLNPAFTQVFGWALSELKGKHIPFIPDDQKEITAEKIRQLMESGETVRFESRRLVKGAQSLDVLISAAGIKDANQEIKEVVVNLRDISDRKELEAQVQAAHRFEALGTLAGGIAHDFNNLLMGIQGNTSLVLYNTDPANPDYDQLKQIEEHVQSGAKLTRQLLGFARGGKYEVKTTDLNQIIAKTARMFSSAKKEIRVHITRQKHIWLVEVDRGQIEQVLLNLYVNASQAMPGGGELYLKTENFVIDEKYSKPFTVVTGKYVRMSVTDTGVGMDESTRKRIFDPFFTTKKMGRGTGLGLATAYGIIKNHGGIINVYSEVRHGTTFNIYLPVSKKKLPSEKTIRERLLKGNETILLVDDEEAVINVASRMLTKLGYNIRVSKSGKEALDIYGQEADKIDAVVLDLIMPDMGGKETFYALKSINPGVKILLSSGYSANGQASEILSHGCNGFIQKPFNLSALSLKLREILDHE